MNSGHPQIEIKQLVEVDKDALTPIQDLDAIASAIHEGEETSRQGVLLQLRFGQCN
jgi:hypothetical protein